MRVRVRVRVRACGCICVHACARACVWSRARVRERVAAAAWVGLPQGRERWIQFALVNYHLTAKNYTLALQLMQILCDDGARCARAVQYARALARAQARRVAVSTTCWRRSRGSIFKSASSSVRRY